MINGTRSGWGVSVTPRPLFTPGEDPVPIVQEAGWALGPVWTGAENLTPTGIWSPDRPARSQSLYRLRYPARRHMHGPPLFLDCTVSPITDNILLKCCLFLLYYIRNRWNFSSLSGLYIQGFRFVGQVFYVTACRHVCRINLAQLTYRLRVAE
jgi:hypothetical protein